MWKGILWNGRGVTRNICHSQFYHDRRDETRPSVGFEITPWSYLGRGIFIAAIIQSCGAAAVSVYVYQGGDTVYEKLLTVVCT